MGTSATKEQVVVYMDPRLRRRLKIEAARVGRSVSDLVERALRRWHIRIVRFKRVGARDG